MFVSGGALLVVYAAQVLKEKEEFRATLAPVWVVLNSILLVSQVRQGVFTEGNIRLILISIIIYAFRIIPYLQNKKKNAADATAAKEDKVVEQIAQKEELVQDDLELVAVISAAIAAATGSSTDGFVVRSIKRR